MARIIETVISVKLSKLAKDGAPDGSVLTAEKLEILLEGLPDLITSLVDDQQIVVEVMELE